MSKEIKINKPEPIEKGNDDLAFSRTTDLKEIIRALEDGKYVSITENFSDGLLILDGLKSHLKSHLPFGSFKEQRKYRAAYHKLSNYIIINIINHKIAVKKAPFIGWLEKLYPNVQDFTLTFPQIQGLNSAWQWYKNGISIPVLRNKIHPFYGTYFPTRFDHLILFDNWLKRYEGPKKTAIDIGIGSGVLSFQMVKYGFQKVYGTDTNPNVIVGLSEFMGDTKLSRKVDLELGNLFGKFEKQTELIVFNPPWLPQSHDLDAIDEAIYYKDNLFANFFAAAKERLLPNGKLLLLFSNLAQIAKLTDEHPIEKELEVGGRFQLEKCFKKKVKLASKKTERIQSWRTEEVVEIWELTHKVV